MNAFSLDGKDRMRKNSRPEYPHRWKHSPVSPTRSLPDRGNGVDLDALVDKGPGARYAPLCERQPARIVNKQKASRFQLVERGGDARLPIVTIDFDEIEVRIREFAGQANIARKWIIDGARGFLWRMVERDEPVIHIIGSRLVEPLTYLPVPSAVVFYSDETAEPLGKPLGASSTTPLKPDAVAGQGGLEEADGGRREEWLGWMRALFEEMPESAQQTEGMPSPIIEVHRLPSALC
jgi:hypothetical protein